MNARDVMTREVVSASPETSTRKIATLLLEKGISAVPVVDDRGGPVGMVSEGDLIGRDEAAREARRDWWLTLLAEGEALNPDFLATLHVPARIARDVMSRPVISVNEETDVREIARLLADYRIKRVPVIRDGRMVGIVSRADLLRAFAAEQTGPGVRQEGGMLAGALAGLDRRFLRRQHPIETPAGAARPREPDDRGLMASEFRRLVADFEHKQEEHGEQLGRAAAEQRRRRVMELIDRHVSNEGWHSLLHKAREAAEHGGKEFMLLRFPNELCSDRGRAINATEPRWPETLCGEAAEVYLRWERDLRPHGFHLAARVLEFPGGLPGDIGLFLVWGNERASS